MKIRQIMENPVKGQKVIILWKHSGGYSHEVYSCPLVCVCSYEDETYNKQDSVEVMFWNEERGEYSTESMEDKFLCKYEIVSKVISDPDIDDTVDELKKIMDYKFDKDKEKEEAAAQKKEDDALVALGICH